MFYSYLFIHQQQKSGAPTHSVRPEHPARDGRCNANTLCHMRPYAKYLVLYPLECIISVSLHFNTYSPLVCVLIHTTHIVYLMMTTLLAWASTTSRAPSWCTQSLVQLCTWFYRLQLVYTPMLIAHACPLTLLVQYMLGAHACLLTRWRACLQLFQMRADINLLNSDHLRIMLTSYTLVVTHHAQRLIHSTLTASLFTKKPTILCYRLHQLREVVYPVTTFNFDPA